jgi:hypothetical protein
MAIDLTYLKKRAEMVGDAPDGFYDDKVQAALAKIIPPEIIVADAADFSGFEYPVKNKTFKNWVDIIPEGDRGFVRFEYGAGDDDALEKILGIAMTKTAFKSFRSAVSKDADDSDLFLMRYLIWFSIVLGQPVGFDFGSYEMNMIFNSLPVDISKNKIKVVRDISFVEFYRMFKFAKWGLENAD